MSLEIEGMNEISAGIKKLIRRIENAEPVIVNAGAVVQKKEVYDDLTVATGRSRDTLTIGQPYKEKGVTYVDIGWTEESKVAFRVHFVEWGTIHIAPQLKITKAVRDSQGKKRQAMLATMRREYGLNV